jgi:hypothetical protein
LVNFSFLDDNVPLASWNGAYIYISWFAFFFIVIMKHGGECLFWTDQWMLNYISMHNLYCSNII